MGATRAGTAKRAAKTGQRRARKANRSWGGAALARTGLASRGVVYLVLAGLSIDVLVNTKTATKANSQGAFDALAKQPGGDVAVIGLALGFVSYAAWRALQAAAGDAAEDGGDELAKRVGWASIALAYVGLSLSAWQVVLGQQGGGNQATSGASAILGLAGGQVLLAAIGCGVVVGGAWLAAWAALQRFDRYLMRRKLPEWAEATLRVFETFGNVVRGLAFAGLGATLMVAAVVDDPHDAKDLNAAVHQLALHGYGRAVLVLVATGFLAFGVSSAAEARYRDVEHNLKRS
jgi:hypothetical protein